MKILFKNIQRAINSIEVQSKGRFYVKWNNKFLINSATILNIKDGIVNITSKSIGNYKGFLLNEEGVKSKIDKVTYDNLFVNDNYIYGIKKNNKLTNGVYFLIILI